MTQGQREAEQEDTHEFLTVLGAMENGHNSGGEDLKPAVLPFSAGGGEKGPQQPGRPKAHSRGEEKACQDPSPGPRIEDLRSAAQGQRSTGQGGDERMTFTGGEAPQPCRRSPQDHRRHSGGQGGEGGMGLRGKDGDAADGAGDSSVEPGDQQTAQQAASRSQKRSTAEGERTGGHCRSDGIGGVRPSVDKGHT